MPTTINSLAIDANALHLALSDDLTVDFELPQIALSTTFNLPDYMELPEVTPLTIASLTDGTVDGTGVFDVLMKSVNAHLTKQFELNRITGADYAKVYLGAVQAVMQFGTQFLLGRDRAQLENLQVLETIKLAQLQGVKAAAELEMVRGQIQMLQFAYEEQRLKAYTARNEYASSKMNLVLGYNSVLEAESKQALTKAQFENAHAQVHDTLPDGSLIGGMAKAELDMKTLQGQLVGEQYELARSQIRDTLSDGTLFSGLVAVEKLMKESQRLVLEEQVDTARAGTKDTNQDGTAITGSAARDWALKEAQKLLVTEQREAHRGQTSDTRSTGEVITGVLGAQSALYKQQVVSYQRDAESKGVKMLLDTWTARKTIDEGVAVPVAIDTANLETLVTAYRGNLEI